MIRRRRASLRAWALITALLACGPATAAAHAIILESEPAAGAKLGEPPARIYLRFNSKLEKRLSRGTLTAADRAAQGAGTATGHFREWRGLSISSLGIGTYLGPDDDTTDTLYEAAVERAIVSGINVVDSAINYRGQRSERAVGRALGRLV